MKKHIFALTLLLFTSKILSASPEDLSADSSGTSWNSRLDSMLLLASTAKQDTNLAELYIDIGRMYADNDFQKAKEYYVKAGELSEKLNWNKGMFAVASGRAGMLYMEGLIDSGLVIIHQAHDLAVKENNVTWSVRLLKDIGNGYFYKNWHETTLKYYHEALNLLEKSGEDTLTLVRLYDNSGVVYRIMGMPEKAVEYDFKALALLGDEDSPLKGAVLYNLATTLSILKDERTAYYFKEALRICQLHNNKNAMSVIYLGLGQLALFDDIDEAEAWIKKAMDIIVEINNINFEGLANLSLGEIEMFRLNLKQAEHYFKTSLDLAQQIGYDEYQVNAHRLLGVTYAMKHDFESFAKSMNRADSVEREMARVATLHAAEEMSAKYETEKKQFEIERQQQVINQQNMRQRLLAEGIAVCSVLLVLLWGMLRLRSRSNAALSEMNATKDRFFSIISHDLKNPAIALNDALRLLAKNGSRWDPETLTEYYGELLTNAVKFTKASPDPSRSGEEGTVTLF